MPQIPTPGCAPGLTHGHLQVLNIPGLTPSMDFSTDSSSHTV